MDDLNKIAWCEQNLVIVKGKKDTFIFNPEPNKFFPKDLEYPRAKFLSDNSLLASRIITLNDFKTFFFYYSLNIFLIRKRNIPKRIKPLKSFLFLNGVPHLSRCLVIDNLSKVNLLNQNFYSWNTAKIERIKNQKDYKFKWFDGNVKTLDLNDSFHATYVHDYPIKNKLLEKTLWSVIVESSGMEDFLSEKIVSPLLAQRPFLYLSSPKTLKFLKSLGFDVFDDIIDISYDVEYDLVKRTQMFSEQVSKISNLDSDSLSDELTHRCEKNFKNVFNLVKTQNLSDDLSKCLDIIFNIERIPNKVKKLYNGT